MDFSFFQKPQSDKEAQEKKFKRGQNELRVMLMKEKKMVAALSSKVKMLKKEATVKGKARRIYENMLIEKNRKIQRKLDDVTVKKVTLQEKVDQLQKEYTNSESESVMLKLQITELTEEMTSSKEATVELQAKLQEAEAEILGPEDFSRMLEKVNDFEKREEEIENKEELLNTQMKKICEYPNMQKLIASLKEELRVAKIAAEAKSVLEKEKTELLAKLKAAEKRELELQRSGDTDDNSQSNMRSEELRLRNAIETLESRCKDAEEKKKSLEEQIRDLNENLANQLTFSKEQEDRLTKVRSRLFLLARDRDVFQKILSAYDKAHTKVKEEGDKENCIKCLQDQLKTNEVYIAKYRYKVEKLQEKLHHKKLQEKLQENLQNYRVSVISATPTVQTSDTEKRIEHKFQITFTQMPSTSKDGVSQPEKDSDK